MQRGQRAAIAVSGKRYRSAAHEVQTKVEEDDKQKNRQSLRTAAPDVGKAAKCGRSTRSAASSRCDGSFCHAENNSRKEIGGSSLISPE